MRKPLPSLPKLSMRGATAPDRLAGYAQPSGEESVSLWLYVAGLCVTLSGLYAVNFSLDDPGFAALTYGLAGAGYVFSFVLRSRGVSFQSMQLPFGLLLACTLLLLLWSDAPPTWLAPANMGGDHNKGLQLIVMWIAVVHTYTLASDAWVLFACVPCMTMIALVSTSSPDPAVQNAFLVFISATTFLLIHENFLRTRTATASGAVGQQRLFGGQVALAGACIVLAFVLANFVAVPIRAVGAAFYVPGAFNALANQAPHTLAKNLLGTSIGEQNELDLDSGPSPSSDEPVLEVRAPHGYYWRGATYDYYTGHSFENVAAQGSDADQSQEPGRQVTLSALPAAASGVSTLFQEFRLPGDNPLEGPPGSRSVTVSQDFTVRPLATLNQIYAAGTPRVIDTHLTTLNFNDAVGVSTYAPLNSDVYRVTSSVPDSDPAVLRAASSSRTAVPPRIAETYLQTAPSGSAESLQLRALALRVAGPFKDNYDRAMALRDYIASHCRYNASAAAPPRSEDAVEYFLFTSPEGDCKSFAGALTMLCRYAGIPARIASGFLPGELQPGGTYLVRERDKHAWTQVYFPGAGWIDFDATENSTDAPISAAHHGGRQASFAAWFLSHGAVPPLIGAVILALLGYLLKVELLDRRWRRPRMAAHHARPATNQEVIAIYRSACRRLARSGVARSAATTPDEFAAEAAGSLERRASGAADLFAALTALAVHSLYSADTAPAGDVQRARVCATALAEALGRRGRPAVEPATAAGTA